MAERSAKFPSRTRRTSNNRLPTRPRSERARHDFLLESLDVPEPEKLRRAF